MALSRRPSRPAAAHFLRTWGGQGMPDYANRPRQGGFPWFPRFQAVTNSYRIPNSIIASRPRTTIIGSLSHGADFHEEIMKIGFVSLLGDSSFPYATLFYVMTSILGILALFGHFFTSKSLPVRRRGFKTPGCAGWAAVAACMQPNCQRVG